MRFVIAGVLGILVVVSFGYLWFAPFSEVAADATDVTARIIGEIGAAINRPAIDPASVSTSGDLDENKVDASRVPYPRPVRFGTRVAGGAARKEDPPPAPAPLSDLQPLPPQPSLTASRLDHGRMEQTEIHEDLSGRKKIVRVFDGRVVQTIEIPE